MSFRISYPLQKTITRKLSTKAQKLSWPKSKRSSRRGSQLSRIRSLLWKRADRFSQGCYWFSTTSHRVIPVTVWMQLKKRSHRSYQLTKMRLPSIQLSSLGLKHSTIRKIPFLSLQKMLGYWISTIATSSMQELTSHKTSATS